MVAFAIAAVGFLLETVLITVADIPQLGDILSEHGHRVGTAQSQVAMVAVTLVWIAVALD